MIISLVSLVVLASFTLADSSTKLSLVKRDPSAVRATRAFQNCVVRGGEDWHAKHPGGGKTCNDHIQMAECYVNARIMNQVFAIFMPEPGHPFINEGGWYGRCCAYNIYPTATEIGEVANPNYACFTWETSDKKQGNGPPTMPKTVMIPFPVICPSNLDPCYSATWYEGGRMASSQNLIPTFTGSWNSPRAKLSDGQDHWLWCHHICGGCPVPKWGELQRETIANQHCDYSKCKKYKGNTQSIGQLTIQPVGTYSVSSSCSDYGSDSPTEGGPSIIPSGGGKPGGGSQGGSGSGSGGNGKGSGSGSGSGGNGKGSGSGGSGGGNGGQGGNGSIGGNGGKGGKGSKGGNDNNGGNGNSGGNGGNGNGKGNGNGNGNGKGKDKGKGGKGGGGKGGGDKRAEGDSDNEAIIRRHHVKEQRRSSIF